MGIEQKVAVITGASQGIGAALVKAFPRRGYRVVATARSIKPSGDPRHRSPFAGDIADRATAERVIVAGRRALRPHRHAGQQRRHLHRKAVHAIHGRGLSRRCSASTSRASSTSRSSPSPRWRSRAAATSSRSRRAWSTRPIERAVGAGLADQGRAERRDQVARDRIRQARHPRERGVARHHQVADASAPRRMRRSARCIRSATWARCPTSSTPCSISSSAASSPARSCTSTAARAPATERGETPCRSSPFR